MSEVTVLCRCGHSNEEHYQTSGACLHWTDTMEFTCECDEFAPVLPTWPPAKVIVKVFSVICLVMGISVAMSQIFPIYVALPINLSLGWALGNWLFRRGDRSE